MAFSGHKARKRFGQHWLKDVFVLKKIVEAADLRSEDRVLEVGPGRGALTEMLLASDVASVHAIELDRDLAKGLKKRFGDHPRFVLQEGDILSVSFDQPGGKNSNKVVANIPYNITSPLLNRLIGGLGKPPEIRYELLVLLLQKEVAERILASPGQSNFSALSVRIQLMANCQKVCNVPPNCFKPSPKVQSQVITLKPLPVEECLETALARKVEALISRAFLSRRKMLRNTLSGIRPFEELKALAKTAGISLDQRPQEISPSSWLDLAEGLNQVNGL